MKPQLATGAWLFQLSEYAVDLSQALGQGVVEGFAPLGQH